MQKQRVLVAGVVAVSVVALLVIVDTIPAKTTTSLSPSCDKLGVNSTNYQGLQQGFSYVCGQPTASDGKLSITLNDYHLVDGRTIDWQCANPSFNGSSGCSTSGVFLLANVTIANVGNSDAPVGLNFYAWMISGSGREVGNGGYGADASFPGQYPQTTVPSRSGGSYLPAGGKATYWFLFNFPTLALGDMQSFRLQYLVWGEHGYGGTWDGSGFVCPCQDLSTQLILVG